ncbi:cytochrome C [Crenobacter cavernae]|uniref:Cytochrome C n=2 Tax=Crenobacter cavernae TaxID=2290923 RepID=A0ABY0FEZ0_9NEIS|nr:cytochrome C [Crenobacter cavernae]
MGVMALALGCIAPAAQAAKDAGLKSVERGRYLVKITGCNDCHTPGFAMSGGQVAEKQWLIGDSLGWRGPWGTTYPSNLRRYVQEVSEGDWLKVARTAELRPPMPVPSLRAMSDADLKAIYRYIRSLGPAGPTAPAYQPPGEEPKGPVVQFPAPPQ